LFIDADLLDLGCSKETVLAALGTPGNSSEAVDESGRREDRIYRRAKCGRV